MCRISIIIPVHNEEKYMRRCIDSCLIQTMNDYEIIVVDDASTDHSREILHEYELKYPEVIRCIYLDKNVKQGGARNCGIKESNGEYLCFVDADDYIESNMCELLYETACSNNSDIVCCNGWRVEESHRLYWRIFTEYDFSIHNSILHFISQCYAIIRRELITNNNLYYPEHVFHEDSAVVPIWYCVSNKITYNSASLYNRTIHDDSTTRSLDVNGIMEIIQVLKTLVDNARRVGVYDRKRSEIDAYIFIRLCVARELINENVSLIGLETYQKDIQYWREYSFDTRLFSNCICKKEYVKTMQFLHIDDHMVGNIAGIIHEKRRQRICNAINELFDQEYQIVVWGYGKIGKRFIEELNQVTNLFEIGDSNKRCQGISDMNTGKVIRDFEWIISSMTRPIFLILSDHYFCDIKSTLIAKKPNIVTADILSYLLYDLKSIRDVLCIGEIVS